MQEFVSGLLTSALAETVIIVLLSVFAAASIIGVVVLWRGLKDSDLEGWAATLVRAADQMLDTVPGPQKLEFVMAEMQRMFPKLDTKLIRWIVEAAVQEMNQQKQASGAVRIDKPS
ncbi:MAG: phage holin, LLH family [Caldilineaceae bacterium]